MLIQERMYNFLFSAALAEGNKKTPTAGRLWENREHFGYAVLDFLLFI